VRAGHWAGLEYEIASALAAEPSSGGPGDRGQLGQLGIDP
jgi:hypothetical protein